MSTKGEKFPYRFSHSLKTVHLCWSGSTTNTARFWKSKPKAGSTQWHVLGICRAAPAPPCPEKRHRYKGWRKTFFCYSDKGAAVTQAVLALKEFNSVSP